jgi:hypothetical protein
MSIVQNMHCIHGFWVVCSHVMQPTVLFIQLSGCLSQEDTGVYSPSYIGNLNCTLFIILDITGCTYDNIDSWHWSLLAYIQPRFTVTT